MFCFFSKDKKVITFKRGEVIKLPLKRKRNRVYITPEMAKQIVPREVQPGTTMSTLTGCLQVKDNLHDIIVSTLTSGRKNVINHYK